MSSPARQLDNALEMVTPENIAFNYRLAGPFSRLLAFMVDTLIRMAVLFLLFLGLMLVSAATAVRGGGSGAAEGSMGLFLLVWFACAWFYGGLFETIWNGQTPGKRMFRLRVVTLDGRPLTASQAVLRNILREVDAFPFWAPSPEVAMGLPLYMVGLLAAVVSGRFQRLGDLACGTLVISEDRVAAGRLPRIDDARAARLAEQLPRSFLIGSSLARTLSLYVSRRRTFSAARQRELSEHLARPLLARIGLPRNIDPDLLLSALYFRHFLEHAPPTSTAANVDEEPLFPQIDVGSYRR